jgi:predicted nuclease of restriction endonuclease-like (RecB) superfamily
MSKSRKPVLKPASELAVPGYDLVLGHVVDLLESARRAAARSVNSVITATYWEIGRRIVEFELAGKVRAAYGDTLMQRLAADLTNRFGRGFSKRNLEQMRRFYTAWQIAQTVSAQFASGVVETEVQKPLGRSAAGEPPILQTQSAKSAISLADLAQRFLLPWSHYVLLLKVEKPEARTFYEAEAHRNGWTVRQLERQITTLFYERTLASRKKGAMLKKGAALKPGEALTPEEEIKDPFVLEFLGLKDEYSESDLEEALIQELETFLLELGGDFTEAAPHRRRVVPDRPPVLPPQTPLPGRHRLEARQVHPRRRRADAPLSELRQGTLEQRGRKPACRRHPLHSEGRSRRPLRPGEPAQQGSRRRVPNGSPRRENAGRRT